MQYAEKVALVPQHYVEDREYKQIQKPSAAVARGTLSLDIKRILNDKRRDDDQKVKHYVNALHRYVNIRDKPLVEREVASNPITRPKTIKTKKQQREDVDEELKEEEESKPRRSIRAKKKSTRLPKGWTTY